MNEIPTATRSSARTRILDTAVTLIAREGFHAARIARIATQAGVSPSLLHYHFTSRDALLAEAIERSYVLAGSLRTGEDTPQAGRLQEMIDRCLPLDGARSDDWLLWVELWLHAGRHPELRATSARLYARMHEWFREAIEEGVDGGEVTLAESPERITDRLLALIDGYGVRALSNDPAMPVARARAEIWAAIAPDLGFDAAQPVTTVHGSTRQRFTRPEPT